MTIASKLADIAKNIEKSKTNAVFASAAIDLMAVTKGQAATSVEEAIHLGISTFGENRVQEASEKYGQIKEKYPNIRLHLIGPLQTNKVKLALGLFDTIQTLDRPKLALAIASELESWCNGVMEKKPSPHHPITPSRHFYVQINTGEEPQKAGIFPKEADEFIRYCRDELKLPIMGLMCIPPAEDVPAPHFALLREIAKRNDLSGLSMGMSDDYEVAIRMGATCIRLGRALFGERPS